MAVKPKTTFTREMKQMIRTLSNTPAGMVAVLLSAKRSGDEALESTARSELIQRWDIFIKFGSDFGRDFRVEQEQDAASKLLKKAGK